MKVARTRRLWPTWRSPGWKVAPLPTSDHTPGPVSACQTNWMVPVLMPLRSLNACVAVSSWSSSGVVSSMITVPVAGAFGPPMARSWSVKLSRSMLRSVSVPSVCVPRAWATVYVPSPLLVMS